MVECMQMKTDPDSRFGDVDSAIDSKAAVARDQCGYYRIQIRVVLAFIIAT